VTFIHTTPPPGEAPLLLRGGEKFFPSFPRRGGREADGVVEAHRLADLAEALSVFIEAYDNVHYSMPTLGPREMLRFLMEQNDLNQSDLPELGSQGVVSEILSGKRSLNVRQISSLAKRFNVSPGVFLES